MRFAALVALTLSEAFWVPPNALGISIIMATAIASLALILNGKA